MVFLAGFRVSVSGLGLAGLACLLSGCGGNNSVERVTLPPGASFAQVTDSLVARRIVISRAAFKLLARLRGLDRSVQAGVYEFTPRVSLWRVLDLLAAGKGVAVRFTVPEGLNIGEVALLAQRQMGVPEDSMLAAAGDGPGASAVVGFPVPSYEGFLRPETYSLPLGMTAREVVREMAKGFLAAWEPGWDARLDSLKMTRLQLVTLGSIVEGEARADDERETIAGVYHNRLRIGMALQADPTVQYAIALSTGARKTRLYEKDYHFPSPYNTYLHPGLPPGPVNSPGHRSLEAALYPAKVPYLYFVAGPDGRHIFSRTYSEHLHAVGRVRRPAQPPR
jgi:peptidoglycan lytic transglycosylase G